MPKVSKAWLQLYTNWNGFLTLSKSTNLKNINFVLLKDKIRIFIIYKVYIIVWAIGLNCHFWRFEKFCEPKIVS